MDKKGFASMAALAVLIGVILGVGGYLILSKNQTSNENPVPAANQAPNVSNEQQPPQQPSMAPNETVNWQTYKNEAFGFQFKYPASFTVVSSGPNEEEKKIEKGEQISGTVSPSYDTVTFSNATGAKFNVMIFPVSKSEVSPDGFMKGYLSMGSVCDTRWIGSVSEGPMLLNENGVPVLRVQVVAGGPRGGGKSEGCYYFKNSAGNVIAFNISGEENSDFSSVFNFVNDKILPTISLTK